jgi:hypothetical protein
MHPPSERLDSSSAAATGAVTFPYFDINAQHALRGTIIVCRQHCAPNMTIAGGTTRGYLKAALCGGCISSVLISGRGSIWNSHKHRTI